jgi:hypothetical protein
MKFRWTTKQLETMTDAQVLRGLIAERKSELNPYTPLATRLQAIYNDLDRQIEKERDGWKGPSNTVERAEWVVAGMPIQETWIEMKHR